MWVSKSLFVYKSHFIICLPSQEDTTVCRYKATASEALQKVYPFFPELGTKAKEDTAVLLKPYLPAFCLTVLKSNMIHVLQCLVFTRKPFKMHKAIIKKNKQKTQTLKA